MIMTSLLTNSELNDSIENLNSLEDSKRSFELRDDHVGELHIDFAANEALNENVSVIQAEMKSGWFLGFRIV
jgi:hypothetical protein